MEPKGETRDEHDEYDLDEELGELDIQNKPLTFSAPLTIRENWALRLLFFWIAFMMLLLLPLGGTPFARGSGGLLFIVTAALVLSCIASANRFHRRWQFISFLDDSLIIMGTRGAAREPYTDVSLAVAEGGFSFDGGEMYIWKSLTIRTRENEYNLRLNPDVNADCFQQIIKTCPNAIGIPFRGSIHVPEVLKNADATQTAATHATMLILKNRAKHAYVGAALMTILAIAPIIPIVYAIGSGKVDDKTIANAVILVLALAGAAFSACFYAFRTNQTVTALKSALPKSFAP